MHSEYRKLFFYILIMIPEWEHNNFYSINIYVTLRYLNI